MELRPMQAEGIKGTLIQNENLALSLAHLNNQLFNFHIWRQQKMEKIYLVVDSVEKLEEAIARTREAQKKFAAYTQEQVDKIFLAAASAANKARIPLAKIAAEETGMGIVEDKVIKNNYASEYIYNAYKNTRTCGVIEEDKAFGRA